VDAHCAAAVLREELTRSEEARDVVSVLRQRVPGLNAGVSSRRETVPESRGDPTKPAAVVSKGRHVVQD
jgi:hypothetical protein